MASNPQRLSNMKRFLECTTPFVPLRSLSKTSGDSDEVMKYFTLGDLWDQYFVISAYGGGVPLVLDEGEGVVQYYVPYLSGIQIYTGKFRNAAEDSERDSWNDDFDESVFELKSRSPSRDHCGHLYYEFFEESRLHLRPPFTNKINELAQSCPGLTKLKSSDLSPSSWMAVYWYPIYQIPARRCVKGVLTRFLTFHTISLSKENIHEDMGIGLCRSNAGKSGRNSEDLVSCVSLPPFGLATCTIAGTLWVNEEAGDQEMITSLCNVARSRLENLNVEHHDLKYFSSCSD